MPVDGLPLATIFGLIRGRPGSKVQLRIAREAPERRGGSAVARMAGSISAGDATPPGTLTFLDVRVARESL
jgi:hypothetical protein